MTIVFFIKQTSKSCQTDQGSNTSNIQALASAYNDLLSGNNRNIPSPPSLLSSMALGNISSLYSPVSPQNQQAAAVAAAIAAAGRQGGNMGGLLSTPVPSSVNQNNSPYQNFNPYLSNVFQTLFQQQNNQHSAQQRSTAASATQLFQHPQAVNLKAGTKLSRSNDDTPILGGSSSSQGPLDFSSVANFITAPTAKRKRTKVTDTRLSARTARKLLDNSLPGPDGQYSSDNLQGNDDDDENDEMMLAGSGDQDDQVGMAGESISRADNDSPVGGSSTPSSRVSIVNDDDSQMLQSQQQQQQNGSNQAVPMLLPFSPNRNHQQIDPAVLAEHSAALHHTSLAVS